MKQQELKQSIEKHPVAMVLSDPTQPDNPLIYVNDAFQRLTLYAADAVLGRNCRFLQCDETDTEARAVLREALSNKTEVTADLLNQRADGTRFLNRLLITPIRDDAGDVRAFLGIQSELPPDLPQRAELGDAHDTMLHELQHRVKNHLSMVVSMIRMQARQDVTRASFEALSHRIQSLALLYEELSPNGVVDRYADSVPAGAYISRVANTIGAIDGRSSIRLNVACDEVDLPVDVGARLGLLVTEFITNAFEHAFAGRDEGVIHVRLTHQTRGKLRLTVEDDGVGLPEGSSWPWSAPSVERRTEEAAAKEVTSDILDTRGNRKRSGAGGSIVAALVQHLHGDLSVSSSRHGTTVTVDIATDEDA